MKQKYYGYLSLLCLVLTAVWLVLLIVSMAGKGPMDTLEQTIDAVAKAGTLDYASYVNMVLLTVLITALFTGLYIYSEKIDRELSLIGLVFVPVYCVLNLFAYLSQITLVPALIDLRGQAQYHDIATALLGQTIQYWQGSLVMVLNNLAYALLGVSSIVFGLLLLKRGKYARLSGALLALNGVACIIGEVGVVANNKLIGMGSLIGGALFLVALAPLTLMFLKESES
jgi:hypothetical protein